HSFELDLSSQVTFTIAGIQILAWETPGHTIGHCCYYAPDFKILFCGDTLFSMGCGRLFEGSPKEMFASLASIKKLPEDTLICCTHEYTLSNLDFALSLWPLDPNLLNYRNSIQKLRESNKPSLPSELGIELTLNPFLRAETVEEFSRLRQLKDQF
ncbi:MAG: MBL fold metallo-hydrolase, partial [Candidatus Cloacimonetes bacterium]|nr:MBL fold metallo-hydrolase [Candidatus Cloacimonadota bacterium]